MKRSAAVAALREAFDADVRRGQAELYEQIWRTYGIDAGESFKAHLWWGWEWHVRRPAPKPPKSVGGWEEAARLRELIRMYVATVVEAEGIDYIDHHGYDPEVRLTRAQQEELYEISGRRSIYASIVRQSDDKDSPGR